jgi:2-polyprenyl-3-methyl-5-hydroxy-6-metoxy-1,4-benzoquinol methylase
MSPLDLEWQVDDASVVLTGNGTVGFSDTRDHWDNGVIRLLGISDADARVWCEAVMRVSFERYSRSPQALAYEPFVDVVGSAWQRCFPPPTVDTAAILRAAQRHNPTFTAVWAEALAHEYGAAVVGTDDPEHGRLVDVSSGSLVEPAEYEQEYFEGEIEGVGYGSYGLQADWRLEKGHRQVRQCAAVARLVGADLAPDARVLDIGSGYGYFRAACEAAGWRSSGIEVSSYAAANAKGMFGFETYVGTLEEFGEGRSFDVTTMWDCIEHVAVPVDFLRHATQRTRVGGLVLLRTPNLMAIERSIFGSRYHSLKLEHLHYFSPRSLAELAVEAGLRPRAILTESHLLQGFSPSVNAQAASTQRGSDFFAVLEVVA